MQLECGKPVHFLIRLQDRYNVAIHYLGMRNKEDKTGEPGSLNLTLLCGRVARWYIFKPKIPIWVNFGGPYVEWKMLASWPCGILTYVIIIWYLLRSFGIYFPCLLIVPLMIHLEYIMSTNWVYFMTHLEYTMSTY
jgi:hypothetical protein